MLKQYKTTLILSSLVILLPIPVGLYLGYGWGTAFPILLLLAAHWFCIYCTAKDPGNKNQNKKPLLLVIWTMPVFSCFTAFVNFALHQDLEFSISGIYCLVFGAMFAAIGNYLPKVKMNSTMGIKVSWAYTSEENWNATHRFGGKTWFFSGLILMAAAFLPQNWGMGIMMADITAACVLPILYSYLYYRKQKKNGDALLPLTVLPAKYQKLSFVFLAGLLVFICGVLFTGNIRYHFEADHLAVEASYHDDTRLYYDAVESIEYREENVDGIRLWGFGSLRLLMGTFENEEFGRYTRYTYYDPDSAVVITTMKKTYVLSGKTPEDSWQLYLTLCEKTGISP